MESCLQSIQHFPSLGSQVKVKTQGQGEAGPLSVQSQAKPCCLTALGEAPAPCQPSCPTLCDSPGPPLPTWQHEGPPEMSEPGGGGARATTTATVLGTLKQTGPPRAGTEVHVVGAVSRALSCHRGVVREAEGWKGAPGTPHPRGAAQSGKAKLGISLLVQL